MKMPANNIYGKYFLDDRFPFLRGKNNNELVYRAMADPGSGGSTAPTVIVVRPLIKLYDTTISGNSATLNFSLYNVAYDTSFSSNSITYVTCRIDTAFLKYRVAGNAYTTVQLSTPFYTKIDGTTNEVNFSQFLPNLSEDTNYEYYLDMTYTILYSQAQNSGGVSNDGDKQLSSSQVYSTANKNVFKTGKAAVVITLPSLTTISVSGITQNSATTGGSITSNGGGIITDRGVVYGTSPAPTTNAIRKISTSNNYSSEITGLSPNTTYYVRAYATNEAGTAYGNELSFITQPLPANIPVSLNTNGVTAITTNSAFSGATITVFGNTTIGENGLIWDTSGSNLTLSSRLGQYSNTTPLAVGTTVPSVLGGYPITGLAKNTTYYVRAYAINSAGTSYGQILSFKTFDILNPGEYRLPTDGVNWYQLYKNWEYDTDSNIKPSLKVSNSARKDIVHPVSYYFNATFSSNKNYQFRTIVENFYDIYGTGAYVGQSNGASFSMRTPWGEEFSFPVPYFHLDTNPSLYPINLYYYSRLPEKTTTYLFKSSMSNSESGISAQNPVTYTANHLFGNSNTGEIADSQDECLTDVRVNEVGWDMQGFCFYTLSSNETSDTFFSGPYLGGKGWHYNRIGSIFTWFDRYSAATQITNIKPQYNSATTITLNENDRNNPVGGPSGTKESDKAYRTNNYLSKYISYQNFNLSFTYQGGRPDTGIRIYMSTVLPTSDATTSNIIPKEATLIASLTQSKFVDVDGTVNFGAEQYCSFVGLEGNQYLYIVGDPVPDSVTTTYSVCQIKNLRVSGGYHSGNNKKYTVVISSGVTYPIFTSATYSTLIGSGNNVNPNDTYTPVRITSKIGNGVFKAGVWENGVWNNGWREDSEIKDFYRVEKFFSMQKDKKWQVHISGPASSLSMFSVGDRVSISNIVAIDLNENRKLLKKYFTIIGKTDSYLAVEFENEFPLRRIEIDSIEHRIRVSKNVWLSGTFFNGYFKGIWNYGLFAGYPFLTKMDETHWIDGIFTGGHFTAKKMSVTFSSAYSIEHSNSKRLGLTFSVPHGLTTGDIVTVLGSIDLGETVVVSAPDEYSLITGFAWKKQYEGLTGALYTLISSGLIQNFDFRSNNVSKLTSMQSMNSVNVFSYNSWMDVNFSDKSAVNIGKPQFLMDELSGRNYPENNLYGYVTTDILSSRATFRDSFSNTVRDYRLGTKYKIYADYVGDPSSFDEYFDPTDTDAGMQAFSSQGWEMSRDNSSYLTFSRTKEPIDNTPTIGKELRVYAKDKGGVLNLVPAYDTPNRTNGEVEKSRYTMVEFEIMTYSVAGDQYTDSDNELSSQPPIHFGNLNYVSRKVGGLSKNLAATYLPVYSNVNHLNTGDRKKQEFFFNKRNLMMTFRGTGELGTNPAEYYIDGLKLYELDMVPFFQYFRNNNINKSIQNPYQAIAPVIDYTDTDLNDAQILSDFVENLTDISVGNGMNWIEDIILRRLQDVVSDFDTDTEDVVIEDVGVDIEVPEVTTLASSDVMSSSAVVAGSVTAGGNTTVRGFVWGTTTSPVLGGGSEHEDAISGEGSFAFKIESLSPATTYYVRAFAQNLAAIKYGNEITFSTKATPMVTTNPVSGLSNTSVTGGGTVVVMGDAITEWGIIWSSGTEPTVGTKIPKTPVSQGGTFTIQINGLAPNSTYNIWAYTISAGITTYGSMVSFATTNVSSATVTTDAITGNTTGTSAISGGNVTSTGGADVTSRGVVWSTSPNPTVALSTKTSDGTGTGAFTSNITGLTPGITYYVRAYAINSLDTAYGTEVIFLVAQFQPTVITGGAQGINGNSLSVLNSSVSSDGGSAITERGVVWATTALPTTANFKKSVAGTTGNFDVQATGLSPLTSYYLRAYATNAIGTAYGSQISFTTTANIPTLTTTAVFDEHIIPAGDEVNHVVFTSGIVLEKLVGNLNYAKSGGTITDTGGAPILEIGLVWTESTNGQPSVDNTKYYRNKIADFATNNPNSWPSNDTFTIPEAFGNEGYSYYQEQILSDGTKVGGYDEWTSGKKYLYSYEDYGYSKAVFLFDEGPGNRIFKIPYMLYNGGSSAMEYNTNSSTSGGTTYGKNGNIEFTPGNSNGRMTLKNPISSAGYSWTNTLTELRAGIQYTVRAYARNSAGIGYGNPVTLAVTYNNITTSGGGSPPP